MRTTSVPLKRIRRSSFSSDSDFINSISLITPSAGDTIVDGSAATFRCGSRKNAQAAKQTSAAKAVIAPATPGGRILKNTVVVQSTKTTRKAASAIPHSFLPYCVRIMISS